MIMIMVENCLNSKGVEGINWNGNSYLFRVSG